MSTQVVKINGAIMQRMTLVVNQCSSNTSTIDTKSIKWLILKYLFKSTEPIIIFFNCLLRKVITSKNPISYLLVIIVRRIDLDLSNWLNLSSGILGEQQSCWNLGKIVVITAFVCMHILTLFIFKPTRGPSQGIHYILAEKHFLVSHVRHSSLDKNKHFLMESSIKFVPDER